MSDEPKIILTNDDGIESPGLQTLWESLSTVGTVTAVAPKSNQSAVGRSMSGRVGIEEHELGYVVDGTPADCVVAGVRSLVPNADLVVSGVNIGANLGSYSIGRSGTVSAAVEAAYFGVPAIAASLYLPESEDETGITGNTIAMGGSIEPELLSEANDATTHLIDHLTGSGAFESIDYLNVNAPSPFVDASPTMELTTPSPTYLMDAKRENDEVIISDRVWERMANGDLPDRVGTDRQVVMDGNVSVTPLSIEYSTERHETLESVSDSYARN
ncbi:5'/3'-nucleotidase SurE [Natrarchaeobius chitinivorans]|uniref:5'-nucleotidase SurE n=1 Tax=Natrarchaeobius chitinivorans TaxID=1679083 RepID=A0A3N6P8B5_NATCH|nr:5'/3'-nucleotidase SurE [Natrarchaeobius chitinivorans]RQG94869.1 5'/3'-nucleotidase SurE [Natrarchaeobius chitinivorans]